MVSKKITASVDIW